ncbi:MAG: polysaccharide biosynthesis protein [Rhizobiales bacterium]|nr:polysaccharide biosynthesis protein [Hyphomicrobiales bacterium]
MHFRTIWKRALATAHDFTMGGGALMIALALRVGTDDLWLRFSTIWPAALLFAALISVCGFAFGLNGGIWRYASLSDVSAIFKTVTLAVLLFVLIQFLTSRLVDLPRSAPLIAWFVAIVLLAGPRLAYRLQKSRRLFSFFPRTAKKPLLLIGATDQAERFLRENETSKSEYDVVGIIDLADRSVGREIRGVSIVGSLEDVRAVMTRAEARDRPVDTILVAALSTQLSADVYVELAQVAKEHDAKFMRLYEPTKRLAGEENRLEIKRVAVDDLLGRRQIELDRTRLEGFLGGRRVLVTGAGGSIGSELSRQIAEQRPAQLWLLDISEFLLHEIEMDLRRRHPDLDIRGRIANVRERAQIFRLVEEAKPDVVVHAAALKHVPIVEAQPLEGLATNAVGTRNVVDAAVASGAEVMVMISTDKAVRPSSFMGATKRLAEMYAQALDLESQTRFVTVRFGNVLGSNGSVVPIFQRQIEKGGPITVTHPDMERYFMTIAEASQLVLQAGALGEKDPLSRGKIYVLDMGQPVKIADLARQMIQLSGLVPDVDVKIEFVGLRPGEKLTEELFDSGETLQQSFTPGIFVASPRGADLNQLRSALAKINAANEAGDVGAGVRELISAVGEYVPDQSVRALAEQASARADNIVTLTKGADAFLSKN